MNKIENYSNWVYESMESYLLGRQMNQNLCLCFKNSKHVSLYLKISFIIKYREHVAASELTGAGISSLCPCDRRQDQGGIQKASVFLKMIG